MDNVYAVSGDDGTFLIYYSQNQKNTNSQGSARRRPPIQGNGK
jgi:hypothetical protein